jgi:hypothetical protein
MKVWDTSSNGRGGGGHGEDNAIEKREETKFVRQIDPSIQLKINSG